MTEWRRLTVSPYRNYEVSDGGDVRRDGRSLQGYVDRYGYRTVLLSYAGLKRRFKVHRLVCEAFHGPQPFGCEVAHANGVRSDNAASNLRWVSRSENTKDQIRHGTFKGANNLTPGAGLGRGNPAARLSDCEVQAIRSDAASGLGGRRLSAKYGISRSTAHRIVTGVQRPQGDAQ